MIVLAVTRASTVTHWVALNAQTAPLADTIDSKGAIQNHSALVSVKYVVSLFRRLIARTRFCSADTICAS